MATLARWLLRPLAGNELPFITCFAAVFVPPVAGGGASGLLSLIGLALFIAIGLGTGIVGESRLQAARQSLDQHGAAGAVASA